MNQILSSPPAKRKGRFPRTVRRHSVNMALAVLCGLSTAVAVSLSASPAGADTVGTSRSAQGQGGPVILSRAWVRDCSNVEQCPPLGKLFDAGVRVHMTCYRLESNAPGYGYWGDKWFLVSGTNRDGTPIEGYVHSSYVGGRQPSVPDCQTVPSEAAVRWAVNGYGGGQSYAGSCLLFVKEAEQYGAKHLIAGPQGSSVTALDWWNANSQVKNWNPPRGAFVFWAPGNPEGHVALNRPGYPGGS